jgi:hypothetical protein
MIDLRYEDGERIVEESLGLREVTDFARWEVPARPGGPQSVRWRLNASFTDGRFLRTGWVETDGPVLTIPLLGRATRELHLLPIHFDASALEGIEVALRSGSVDTTISLRDRQAKVVRLPPGSFSCSITWIRRDGSRSSQPPRDLDDDVLVIPRAPT